MLGKSCVKSCDSKSNRYSPAPKECYQCHEECQGCHGPGSTDCFACKNFKYRRYAEEAFECLSECPKNTYLSGNDCLPCHDNCFNEGCNGPGNILNSGCKKCRYGREYGNEFHCLWGNSTKTVCQEFEGYYMDVFSDRAELGECKKCPAECKKCIGKEDCTECVHYQVVTNSNVTEKRGCVAECGK